MAQHVKVSRGGGASFSVGSASSSFKTYGNPLPYVAPWLVAGMMLLLAMPVRYVLARDDYSWFWSAGAAGTYALLTYGVFRASRARGTLTNWAATLGTGAAGAWSWYVAGVPDLTWRPFAAYAMGVVVTCGVSNALSAFREGGQPGPTMSDRLDKALAEVRNINSPRVVNGSVVAEIEAVPGSSITELQKDVPKALESLHDLPEGSVRITKGKPGTSTRAGQVHLSPVDFLSTPQPWPGLSIRDGSGPYGYGTLMDPIGLGLRQGGVPLQLWLPGDARVSRNASLIQTTGQAGAGKSQAIRTLTVEGMSRGTLQDFEYWYLNPRKADQEPDWMRRGAARFESKKRDVIRALRDLKDEIDDRQRLLGQAGYEQWSPGAPVPLRLVIADEFAEVAPDAERLITDLAETLRSLGIILLVGLQRATGDRFPTSARSNFGTHWCFGVRDETDASMGLPDEVLDALPPGAGPARWGTKVPGMCYLTAPGVPEDLWTEPGRTWAPAPALLEQWAEHLIALRSGQTSQPPASPARPDGAVQVYTEKGDVVDGHGTDDHDGMLENAGVTVPDDVADLVAGDVVDLDSFDDEAAAQDARDLVEEVLADDPDADDDEEVVRPTVPADVADVHGIDHREPITVEGGGWRLQGQPKMPPAQAQEYLRQHLIQLRATGTRMVKVEEFGEDVLAATGYGATWLSKHLGRLSEGSDALLRKLDDKGWYEFRAAALPDTGDRP